MNEDDDDFGDIPDEDLLALDDAATRTAPPRNRRQLPWPVTPSSANGKRGDLPGREGALSNATTGNALAVGNGADARNSPSAAFDDAPHRSTAARSRQFFQSQKFRQTTLCGSSVQSEHAAKSRVGSGRRYRGDASSDRPTHHELDIEALKTWTYPLNLGPIRDYQFSIARKGLFNNTLVALPTGLGKTFIAATIMLNYYRWTKTAKIIFVAPTKPLVAQQVEACLTIAGIPRSQVTLLTGETPPVLRETEWTSKRVFFMTPQTLQNDLSKGYADPKTIVLMVVDEAHRATGDYAYVKVIDFMRRFSESFRVLALTATPGSKIEGVQSVIDSLGISEVEIRTEDSIDIRDYVHSRNVDIIKFDPSDEMLEIKSLFAKAVQPLVNRLSAQNIYWGRDPLGITTFGLQKNKEDWVKGPGRQANQGVKWMVIAVFTVLQKLAHALKLLDFHGIIPFYHYLVDFRNEDESGGKGSRNKREILEDEYFVRMMATVEKWRKVPGFTGHPKLEYMCNVLVDHFMNNGDGTRAIVFNEYRDSAEEIVRILKDQPHVKPAIFVGQADSQRNQGMKQKQQIEAIEKFRNGTYNVLVATSIGEEGLDIGQVDLIVCCDASASPIRMLQRMGRTGRKRAGKIVLLLMKGKEENKFEEAKDNYEKMQLMICRGSEFNFRHDLSTRILPQDAKPEVDRRLVDIPVENTQDPSLPEPRKTKAGLRRKPSGKKFHMPDAVETGFVKASVLDQLHRPSSKPSPAAEADLADCPALEAVVLTKAEDEEFTHAYRNLPLGRTEVEEIALPSLGNHPAAQRSLRRTVDLRHGEYTKRCMKLFKMMGEYQQSRRDFEIENACAGHQPEGWRDLAVDPFADDTEIDAMPPGSSSRAHSRKRPRRSSFSDEVKQTADAPPRKQRKPARRSKRAVGPKTDLASFILDDLAAKDEEQEEEYGEDAQYDGELTASSSRCRGVKQVRRRRNLQRDGGNHLGDPGDDCTRTSDMQFMEDSEDGEDVESFVIGDDQVTASVMRTQQSRSSTGPDLLADVGNRDWQKLLRPSLQPSQEKAEKPFYVPLQLTATQESDDEDMPDLADLVTRHGSATKKRSAEARVPPPSSGVQDGAQDGAAREGDGHHKHDSNDEEEDAVLRPGAIRKRAVADSDDDD